MEAIDPRDEAVAVEAVSGLWWIWLIVGILWVIASLVILQFDQASITTIGIIVGIMFLVASAQQMVLAAVADSLRWVYGVFGFLFLVAGVVCLINPTDTFAGLADMLGFLFLLVGFWWVIRAFLVRALDSTWWLSLVAGILMIIMAFWTSGQLFIHKAYVLVAFAGIWALLQGITDIVRAFAMRHIHKTF